MYLHPQAFDRDVTQPTEVEVIIRVKDVNDNYPIIVVNNISPEVCVSAFLVVLVMMMRRYKGRYSCTEL